MIGSLFPITPNLGYLLVVSADFWKKLSADIRTELEAITKEVVLKAREYAAEADRGDRKKISQAGKAKLVESAVEERSSWRAATKKVEKEFAKQIGKPLLKDVHQLLGH